MDLVRAQLVLSTHRSSGRLDMIFGTFLLLYRHGRSLTAGLSPTDVVDMRSAARAHAIGALPGPLHAWNGRQGVRAKERVIGA